MKALYGDTSIPLRVCRSAAGYYIGRLILPPDDMAGAPYARDSAEYYATEDEAGKALKDGAFTLRSHP
jgi:hypothetical protein